MATKDSSVSGLGDVSSLLQPINTTGMTQDSLEAYNNALNTTMESLAARYDQPNWGAISAGFLKPQLGGFGASLGSAMQAVGENEDNRRQNMLPVAVMRARLTQTQLLQKQWEDAKKLYSSIKKDRPNEPLTPAQLAQLDEFGETPTSKAAKNETLNKAQQVQTQIGVGSLAKLTSDLPGFTWNVGDLSNKDIDDPTKNARLAEMQKYIPYGMDPAKFKAMPIAEQYQLSASAKAAEFANNLDESKKADFSAGVAARTLPMIRSVRDLATSENMDKMLGAFQGPELANVIGQTFAEGKIGPQAFYGIQDKLAKVGATPEQIDNFQKLVKGLAVIQREAAGGTSNPTDDYRALVASGSPTTLNSQKALVGILDSSALDQNYSYASAALRNSLALSGKDSKEIPFLTPYRQLNDHYANLKSQIALDKNVSAEAQAFYSLGFDFSAADKKRNPNSPNFPKSESQASPKSTGNRFNSTTTNKVNIKGEAPSVPGWTHDPSTGLYNRNSTK